MKKQYRLFLAAATISISAAAQNFINPLNIPPALSGSNFTLTAAADSTQFYPGIYTSTYGYNGSFLGPTLMMNKDDSAHIQINNNLAESTTVHWHGMHVPALMDGGPQMVIPAGGQSQVDFKVMNDASTCWYHPHVHMNTMPQVNMGLAGFIYVYDTVEAALNLPRTYGTDDFPVVLQDRTFGAGGEFVTYALADSMLVNGTAKPYLNCPAQVVRLRLLNGSNARNYNIGFSDNRNFYVIASDGGLLAQPFTTNRLVMSSGERYEILVDLTANNIGDQLVMMSYGSVFANNEPGGGGMQNGTRVLNATDFGIMQLNVVAQNGNPVTSIPSSLIAVTPWNASSAARTRNKTLAGMGMFDMGNFTISGLTFDMMIVNDTIIKDDIEIWHIANTSTVAHPFHIHDVPFYVLHRNGGNPNAQEAGLKDVIYLKSGENADLIMKFSDFANDTMPYMYHCHNLAHEDMGMMLQFIVIEQPNGIPLVSNANQNISAYPNPSENQWTISLKNATEDSDYFIYDQMGRMIASGTVPAGTENFKISSSEWPEGIYNLVFANGESIRLCKSGK